MTVFSIEGHEKKIIINLKKKIKKILFICLKIGNKVVYTVLTLLIQYFVLISFVVLFNKYEIDGNIYHNKNKFISL
jgi:hypothetical protein